MSRIGSDTRNLRTVSISIDLNLPHNPVSSRRRDRSLVVIGELYSLIRRVRQSERRRLASRWMLPRSRRRESGRSRQRGDERTGARSPVERMRQTDFYSATMVQYSPVPDTQLAATRRDLIAEGPCGQPPFFSNLPGGCPSRNLDKATSSALVSASNVCCALFIMFVMAFMLTNIWALAGCGRIGCRAV